MLFTKYEMVTYGNCKGSDKISGVRYFAPSTPLCPFDISTDYLRYVDGKPRYEGVRSFLESRSIDLPYGNPEEPPNLNTICGLGNRKNELVNELLASEGVEVYEGSLALLHQLRHLGIKTGMPQRTDEGTMTHMCSHSLSKK